MFITEVNNDQVNYFKESQFIPQMVVWATFDYCFKKHFLLKLTENKHFKLKHCHVNNGSACRDKHKQLYNDANNATNNE